MPRHHDAEALCSAHAIVGHHQRFVPEFLQRRVRQLSISVLKPLSLAELTVQCLLQAQVRVDLLHVPLRYLGQRDLSQLLSLLLKLQLRVIGIPEQRCLTVVEFAPGFQLLPVDRLQLLICGA